MVLLNLFNPPFDEPNHIVLVSAWEALVILDEDIPEHAGEYYSQTSMYRDNECNEGGWPMNSPNPKANDRKLEDGLWALSCSEVGITESKPLKKGA